MFSWRAEVRPGVWVAFTDAGAGNLALHVGDDPAAVRRRRAELEAAAGLGGRSFQYMNQVHGSDVAIVGPANPGAASPTADAMVSLTEPLAVMVADCVPVVLVGDVPEGAPVLGVVHAGRPGVAAGVVPAAVASLRGLGADRVSAWIGPSICGRCYEVPEDLRADVAAAVPATWCSTSAGTPGLDLPAGVRSQLEAEGVAVEHSAGCTLEDETLFSYRRNSRTGRFAGLVWTDAAPEKTVHGHE
ncbi:polyphenol oxidase family protein [Arthrobacter sp. PM3]|uniref:polyphenol oxidase family protein n=1 Tax=Arthrobacter sp. PM3 TaxID=2017685 RepID=UPI000E1063B8|nr:polyphenol oxidase family protein [Arthrobacter sp. PM3]AXJ10743.1 copper oxidase [Arthrobacter sp. PM3]